MIMIVIILILLSSCLVAQDSQNKLISELWKRDSCILCNSNREFIAVHIVQNKLINSSEELVGLLGEPIHINKRKSGVEYYVYPSNVQKDLFYSCNILALVAFKFNSNGGLENDELYYFIGDMEEEHMLWNLENLPKTSHQGNSKEPYPFKYMK